MVACYTFLVIRAFDQIDHQYATTPLTWNIYASPVSLCNIWTWRLLAHQLTSLVKSALHDMTMDPIQINKILQTFCSNLYSSESSKECARFWQIHQYQYNIISPSENHCIKWNFIGTDLNLSQGSDFYIIWNSHIWCFRIRLSRNKDIIAILWFNNNCHYNEGHSFFNIIYWYVLYKKTKNHSWYDRMWWYVVITRCFLFKWNNLYILIKGKTCNYSIKNILL